jgi:hypothetical protein
MIDSRLSLHRRRRWWRRRWEQQPDQDGDYAAINGVEFVDGQFVTGSIVGLAHHPLLFRLIVI